MYALVFEEIGKTISYKEVQQPTVGSHQVLVKVRAAALNHRDVYITQGLYPGIVTPVILGSDGAGDVVEIGEGVDKKWLNQAVLLNPSIGWEDTPNVQPLDYQILGMPSNGCFAEYVVVDAKQLALKPTHLSYEEAAALPLAGLTAYRALFSRANVQANDRVLISGIGGGVALIACQLAIAFGAEVYVTSSSEDKINRAIALGAKGGVNYKNADWYRELSELADAPFDVIIDSAGGEDFKHFLDLANMGGRIAFYGGTRGSFKVSPQKMFWKQLSMFGSTMGNSKEFGELLDFVNKTKLVPVVDSVWSLEQGAEAFELMNQGKQFGKIIISCKF